MRLRITDMIIKNLLRFFLFNSSDNKQINIRNSKSINKGDILKPLLTVMIRKNRPLIKLDSIKNISNKKSSFITFIGFLNCFFDFINITKSSIS